MAGAWPGDPDRAVWGTSPFVGRQLRGLLHAAGFVDVQATARGTGGGGPGCVGEAEFQASFFDARPVIDLVTERGLASPDEIAAIAAWRRWGNDRRRPQPVTGLRPSPGSSPTDHYTTARLRRHSAWPGSSPIVATASDIRTPGDDRRPRDAPVDIVSPPLCAVTGTRPLGGHEAMSTAAMWSPADRS